MRRRRENKGHDLDPWPRVFGRMPGDGDPQPAEMWGPVNEHLFAFVSGEIDKVPSEVDTQDRQIDPNDKYDEKIMTPRRQEAIRRALAGRGPASDRLIELVCLDDKTPEIEE